MAKRANEPRQIDLPDRLMAALLAPLFFIASILIVYFLFNRYRITSSGRFSFLSVEDIGGFFLAAAVCPAIYGFLVGTDGVVSAIGHMFLTHPAGKSPVKAVLYWAVFSLLVIVAIKMVS